MDNKRKAIVIADAGGTKITWGLLRLESSAEYERFSTPGMNILLATADKLIVTIGDAADRIRQTCNLENREITDLYFYAAGCSTPEAKRMAVDIVGRFFPATRIFVESDMLGAARATLGRSPGIACILGTGSNSCQYDGETIVHKVPSLGYILGDDGSGAALGRRLLRNVIQTRIPKELCKEFFTSTGESVTSLIDSIYRKPLPNRFLASFAPWIREHIDQPEILKMVLGEFRDFFRYNILAYPEVGSLPVALCGSIASHFSLQLQLVAEETGLQITQIVADPLPGLISYHSKFLTNIPSTEK